MFWEQVYKYVEMKLLSLITLTIGYNVAHNSSAVYVRSTWGTLKSKDSE